MTEKDRIRKQIKKQNAPELTEEQMVGKREGERRKEAVGKENVSTTE